MTAQYSNRTEMLRAYPGARDVQGNRRDVTGKIRDELTKALEQEHGSRVEFKTVATSAGTYGVNGAIIEVSDRATGERLELLSIKGRTLTLFEFV